LTYTGFKYNGFHSFKDFGLSIEKREIGNPSKIKRLERVPFSNTNYDFSNIYGGQEFEERTLSYEVNVAWKDKSNDFYSYETEFLNWLGSVSEKQVLVDDLVPGFYFLAEVVNQIDTDFLHYGGKSIIEFTAYPFKIGEHFEGNDIWDDFNFLLDYAQDTKFEINGSKAVTLYNLSATTVVPQIVASSPMQIKRGNTTYQIPKGSTQSHDFMLLQNENHLTITGDGTIEFKFRKELI